MKSTLARLGIRWFKPTLRRAEEKLGELRTAEGTLLPENTREELGRDMARLRVVREQLKEIEQQRLRKLEAAAPAEKGPHAMIHLIARVMGIGIETADMLVNEILSRHLRDSKAVARYAGLTGSPDESGKRRREKGLARAGNARVRRGMIQLAWRFLRFQKDSELAQWFRARAADGRRGTRKTMIVALARKLLIAPQLDMDFAPRQRMERAPLGIDACEIGLSQSILSSPGRKHCIMVRVLSARRIQVRECDHSPAGGAWRRRERFPKA